MPREVGAVKWRDAFQLMPHEGKFQQLISLRLAALQVHNSFAGD
jgi:hypothetical protein